jgi:hypothetical protein
MLFSVDIDVPGEMLFKDSTYVPARLSIPKKNDVFLSTSGILATGIPLNECNGAKDKASLLRVIFIPKK